jgi:type IV fimbrial biogenesis protein FimT
VDHEEGRVVLTSARERGFSLIELLVAVSVIAILMAVAVPNFTTWIRNAQVRTLADVLQSSIRLAQTEAQRRNQSVVLFRTADASCSETATANATGMHWQLRSVPNPLMTDATDAAANIQCGSFGEAGSQAAFSEAVTALCFSSDGRQTTRVNPAGIGVNCTAGAARYTVATAQTPAPPDSRRLRIDVSLAGSVRMCDPDKVSTAPDGCR